MTSPQGWSLSLLPIEGDLLISRRKNITLSVFALSILAVPTTASAILSDPGYVHDSHTRPSVSSRTVVRITPPDRLPDSQLVTTTTLSPEQRAYEAEKTKYLAEVEAQGLCVEWAQTALDAGWEPQDLPRLMRIMHRESRCIPTACGETDSPHVRKCRDWGLMQINDYSWKRVIRNMGWKIEDMWIPVENLKFARWLFEYSLERNGDGWYPWKKISK